MKKLHILAVALTTALASTVAIAQSAAPMASHKKIDVDGDGAISKAEAAAFPRLAEKFDRLDADKDGRLSAAERPRHRAGKRGGHGRMQALDADNDQRISRAEAQAGKARFAERFDQMDINHDGYLDRADMQQKMVQKRAEFFSGADGNGDGRLSRDEFVVEQGARRAERRERFRQRAEAAGKARPMPTEAERIQRAGTAFDRMDANKDGSVSRAEFDAFKPMRHARKHREARPAQE